jgi:DNA modification methylase
LFGRERFLNEIIWCYHGPSPITSAFKRKHDTILVYTRSSDYIFNADAVRVPYDRSTLDTFASSRKAGFGKVPDLERGKVPEDWWYFPVVARLHNERVGYETQKPLALLDRIIRASSNPGDTIADFFCGSGTSLVSAAANSRRFAGCDSAPLAVSKTAMRLEEMKTRQNEVNIWCYK